MRSRCQRSRFLRLSLLLLLLSGPAVGGSAGEPAAIRFGILSIASPARIHRNWQPFADHLARTLGQPVMLVVPRGFRKLAQAVETGQVDFFYVNSYVFYRLKQAGRARGVAQMENIDGKVTSRSEIFVRRDSGITRLADLKGRSIAFVSPLGAGGYLAPRAYLAKLGLATGRDVQPTFTRNLANSIHQVLLGDVEAGTMCGVNFKLMQRKLDTGELMVIGRTEAYPENLIAARRDLDSTLVGRFRDAVLEMSKTAAGRQVLAQMQRMKIRRFVPYDPAVEAITRRLLQQSGLE